MMLRCTFWNIRTLLQMTLWRARFLLKSFGNLPISLSAANWRALCNLIEEERNGAGLFCIDILLERDDIKTAFFESYDILDDLSDAIAFLSYAPVTYEMLSVTIPKSVLGVPFLIAIPNESYRRGRIEIERQKLEKICGNKGEEVSIALRAFRSGVSADSPYESLRELWTAVEAMGAKAAAAAQDFNEAGCKCGAVRRIGLKSAKHSKLYFRPSGKNDDQINYKKIANEAYDLSNKLEHGSKLRDSALREQSDYLSTSVQSAAAVAISEELNVKTDGDWCPRPGMRFITVEGIRQGDQAHDCQFRPVNWNGKLQMSGLSTKHSDCKPGFSIDFGMLFPFPVHPLGFPDPADEPGSECEILLRRVHSMLPNSTAYIEQMPMGEGVVLTMSGPLARRET